MFNQNWRWSVSGLRDYHPKEFAQVIFVTKDTDVTDGSAVARKPGGQFVDDTLLGSLFEREQRSDFDGFLFDGFCFLWY